MGKTRKGSLLDPAPPWEPDRCEHVILWHGCTARDRDRIEGTGIDLAQCRVDTDFGRGFYTTTIRRQAEQWAWDRLRQGRPAWRRGNQAVVLRFRVSRARLGRLRSLQFVLGDFHNEDFWSLVQHCRRSVPAVQGRSEVIHDHRCPRFGWYDVVTGPVAAFWRQRVAMADADQVSFHTPKAVQILNALVSRGKAKGTVDYQWEPVVPQ